MSGNQNDKKGNTENTGNTVKTDNTDYMDNTEEHRRGTDSLLDRFMLSFMKNRLVVVLITLAIVFWGIVAAPFDWDIRWFQRDPVPVDAIPDLGENQQIVFTDWMGRSPQDVEDQVTYPLTAALMGISGVKTVRSFSMFGFSSIYVIFKEEVDFYWSRSRILEKLNSLPPGLLPEGVKPALGPDATALGQVFWYTLEGRDEKGQPAGGWDLHELRTIQDWYVRFALLSVDGVAEVASAGGFVQEYQIDVDPAALRAYGVTLEEVFTAVRMSNLDVGARTIEINKVEYIIRGLGFIRGIRDIENSVIKVRNNAPIYIRNIAKVALGPALRSGALDKDGTEAVGGVAVVRYGENPLKAIKNLKEKIKEIAPGLPRKKLPDGRLSQVTITPFYDRTQLIHETLDTLSDALADEILVTIIVILIMLMNFRSSVLISALLPLAVLMAFIGMKLFHVDANIVALSGIAIAIGAMVDMSIIMVENIIRHIDGAPLGSNSFQTVYNAAKEVGGAVLTAIATTVVSFLPVFTMEAAEGKLFKPLAYTKTFALIASVLVAIIIVPTLSHWFLVRKKAAPLWRRGVFTALKLAGIVFLFIIYWWAGFIVAIITLYHLLQGFIPEKHRERARKGVNVLAAFLITVILASRWTPLGVQKGFFINLIFAVLVIGGILLAFYLAQVYYLRILRLVLAHKGKYLSVIGGMVVFGAVIWLGFGTLTSWLPDGIRALPPMTSLAHHFPGLGKEFMPPLDEGSFLYMPTTMPHASTGEVLDVLKKQDMGFRRIPEIDTAVGKIGRAESPLDPAPFSMIETVINYKPKFKTDEKGERLLYRYDRDRVDLARSCEGEPFLAPDGRNYQVKGVHIRDDQGGLIPDSSGEPFSHWRPALDPDLNPGRDVWRGIRSPVDIWAEIVRIGKIPGTTSAPMLQPIAARIVMLQSGMRAPMGIKIKGPDLEAIEKTGLLFEKWLKNVPLVDATTVFADRIVGKPYLEIVINREAAARYGVQTAMVQDIIEMAVGGKTLTTTVEGRERYAVRVRYQRELRDSIEGLRGILIPGSGAPAAPPSSGMNEAEPQTGMGGMAQIPLQQLADIRYVRGADMIKSEDTFLTGYVLFDKKPGAAEVDVVNAAARYFEEEIKTGKTQLPNGVSYTFSGSYENQIRSEKKLILIMPVALFIIFLLLYFQFRRVSTTLLVFSGVFVAWAGGFILIWLYGQGWFMDFSIVGVNMRDVFLMGTINLSVAVWVGFLALFGIATDDGVLIATYLDQSTARLKPQNIEEARIAVAEAGQKRIRPAAMTSATTILALLPVLSSQGRGADIMIPMAIPTFGGMIIAVLTWFTVPVLYCWLLERKVKKGLAHPPELMARGE